MVPPKRTFRKAGRTAGQIKFRIWMHGQKHKTHNQDSLCPNAHIRFRLLKPNVFPERSNTMPLIEVKMIEGVFTTSKKKEIITKLTDAMVSIEGENLRPYTLVVLEEVRSGDWAVGGKSLGTAEVQALAAGKVA
jgi:4-oxalocrotonate tautomerase